MFCLGICVGSRVKPWKRVRRWVCGQGFARRTFRVWSVHMRQHSVRNFVPLVCKYIFSSLINLSNNLLAVKSKFVAPLDNSVLFVGVVLYLSHCGCRWLLFHLIFLFVTHTLGKAPLDQWSACDRGLYLHNTNKHRRQISMPPAWFEPAISAIERPQTDVLARPPRSAFCVLWSLITADRM
jgi:hypothetical protein